MFETAGSNPLLLESVVNDFSLSQTTFVLVHGGFPFDRAVSALIQKPNVRDFSAKTDDRAAQSTQGFYGDRNCSRPSLFMMAPNRRSSRSGSNRGSRMACGFFAAINNTVRHACASSTTRIRPR